MEVTSSQLKDFEMPDKIELTLMKKLEEQVIDFTQLEPSEKKEG